MRIGFMRKDQIEAAIVKTTRMLASKGIKVTQRGHQAFCAFDKKGNVTLINLPVLPDEPTQEFLDALQGYLDHEVSHALYTNSLQAEDVATHSTLNVSPAAKASLLQLANVVEDVRIEARVPKDFPGAEANLNKLRAYIIDTVWRPTFTKLQAQSGLDPSKGAELLGNALIPYLRGLGGQRICREFIADMGLEPLFGPLNAAIPDLQKRLVDMKDTGDAVRLAELIMKVNAPPMTPPKSEDEPEDDGTPQNQPDPKDEDEGKGASAEQDGDDNEKPDQKDDQGDDKSDEKGGKDGAEQDDTDKDGEGQGDPDPEDEDAGKGADDEGSGSKEDDAQQEDEGDPERSGDQPGDEDDDEGDDESDDDGDDQGDDESDEDEDGDQGSGGGKRNMSLEQAMRRIDPLQRRALFKYNNRRMSVDKIAADLNCDEATVTDLLKNGRRNLNRLMRGGK